MADLEAERIIAEISILQTVLVAASFKKKKSHVGFLRFMGTFHRL